MNWKQILLLFILELRNTTIVIILYTYISCIISLLILVKILHFSLYLVVFKGGKLIT